VKLDEDKLRFMYQVEGLFASAIASQLKCGRGTVLLCMKRADIEIKKHYYNSRRLHLKVSCMLSLNGGVFLS